MSVCRAWIDSPYGRGDFSLLNPRLWLSSRGNVSKRGPAFAATVSNWRKVISGIFVSECINADNALCYVCGMGAQAAALAKLSEKIPLEIVIGSDGDDLELRGRWFASTIASLCRLYVPSSAALRLLESRYPDSAHKFEVRPAGTSKKHPDIPCPMHTRSDRNFTFLSVGGTAGNNRVDLATRLMKALSVARPDTSINWIHLGSVKDIDAVKRELAGAPSNLDYEFLSDSDDAVSIYTGQSVDWSLYLSAGELSLPREICESLSYGVPVIGSDTPGVNEIVDVDSGLLLSADPTDEEFVRGIAPYLDSDYRSAALRQSAFEKWKHSYDASIQRAALAEELADI